MLTVTLRPIARANTATLGLLTRALRIVGNPSMGKEGGGGHTVPIMTGWVAMLRREQESVSGGEGDCDIPGPGVLDQQTLMVARTKLHGVTLTPYLGLGHHLERRPV